MPDLADSAYAHAVAVLGEDAEVAFDGAAAAALAGLRRGGRSLTAVLGHTRAEALARAVDLPTVDLESPAPEHLVALAVALAGTRPPVERAIVDLESRHGLDRVRFARALGLPVGAAAQRAAEVTAEWQRDLDPAVLAHLGPAGCDALGAVLEAAGVGVHAASDDGDGAAERPRPVALAALLAASAPVLAHTETCEVCRDRLRAMVSVRALVGQLPVGRAPSPVRAASRTSRPRRPAPIPPLDAATPPRRRRRLWVPLSVAAALLVVVGSLAVLVARSREQPNDTRVADLTRVSGTGASLVATPDTVIGPVPAPVTLRNVGTRPARWEAVPDARWILPLPAGGTLDPGGTVVVRLSIASSAPEGDLRGTVTFAGADGASAVVRVAGVVERPPDVSAAVNRCAVLATVEDEGEVKAVVLHWLERSGPKGTIVEKSMLMPSGNDGYRGMLPDAPYPITWWVTAVDARANLAKTAEQTQPANACT